jgi:hypothetical protein
MIVMFCCIFKITYVSLFIFILAAAAFYYKIYVYLLFETLLESITYEFILAVCMVCQEFWNGHFLDMEVNRYSFTYDNQLSGGNGDSVS